MIRIVREANRHCDACRLTHPVILLVVAGDKTMRICGACFQRLADGRQRVFVEGLDALEVRT